MSKIGHDVIGRPVKIGGKVGSAELTQVETEKYESQLKKYLSTAKVVALSKSPFLYSVLNGLEIRTTDKVPVAAVDANGVLYLNPKGIMEVAPLPKQGVSLLLHEALHCALGHFKRLSGPNINHTVANIAEDAVINNALEESGYLIDLPIYKEGKLVDMRTISNMTGKPISELKDKDAEEIYDMLMKDAMQKQKQRGQKADQKSAGQQIEQDASRYGGWSDESADTSLGKGKEIEPADKGKIGKQEAGEGNVLQKGHPDVYKQNPITGEKEYDPKAALNKAKVDSEMMGKGVGTLPAGLARIVNKLTESKVDWRSQLRTQLQRGLGSLIISSWQVPSRRWGESYPGTKMVTKPDVWCIVDTSGSISQEQLEQFMAEVYSISRNFGVPVHVLPFDAQYYEILTARRPDEVVRKVMMKMKGGGGTEIEPAITHLLEEKKFKPKDAVVIMSDGDIFDLGRTSVKDKMNRLANNSSTFIFLTVRRPKEELRPHLPQQTKLLEVRD